MATTSDSVARLYISHAPDGTPYANKLSAYLDRLGVTALVAPDQSNGLEMDALRRGIERCGALLIVMTTGSDESEQVMEEVDLARRADKPIFGLLLSGRRHFVVNQDPYENVARGDMPSPGFVDDIQRALGLQPSANPPRRTRLGLMAGVAGLVLAIAVGVSWFATSQQGKTPNPPPSDRPSTAVTSQAAASPSGGGGDLPARGKATIASPKDGATVDQCFHLTGAASLDSGKTMLFAKMRTSPPDQTWYFDFVGPYRNGFVPPRWSATEYLGTTSGQRYDVFLLVMDVAAADAFWKAHQSKDGSYAFATAIPSGAERAAVVRVLQGTTDGCT